eukprot:8791713-Heterocapsa_arctica.AAC.1
MVKPDLEEARKEQLGKLYTLQTERYLAAHNRKRQAELFRQKIHELGHVIAGGEPRGDAVEGNQPGVDQEDTRE